MKKLLRKINIIRHACDFLAGDNHKFLHRAIVGVIVMTVGVIIFKTLGYHDTLSIAVAGSVVGHSIHGIGLIPFVEYLLENS